MMKREVTLSLVTLAILAGCGGGGDDSPGIAVSPSPPAPTAPSPTATSPIVAPPPATPAAPAPINAAPSQVQNVTITGGQGVVDLAWSHSPESDVAGYLVWRDLTPNFVPKAGNLIYDSSSNTLKDVIAVNQDTSFYYRVAAYDVLNKNLSGTGLSVSQAHAAIVHAPATTPAPNQPPPPPPEPAPGTFILGSVVKKALNSNPFNLGNCNQQYYYYSYNKACDTTAYESVDGKPDKTKQGIQVGFWLGANYMSHYQYPVNYDYGNPNPKFPQAQVSFNIVYPNNIFAFGKTVTTYSDGKEKALTRSDDFQIRDDHKFILNKTAVQWTGVEGEPYFLQFQISTYAPSNTVFKVCMHEYFPGVRRLACTLHDKDSGQYRGTQVLDDSRGLGTTEYLPLNE